MADPLTQEDIDVLASKVERLGAIMGTLSEAIASQEENLASIGEEIRERFVPYVEKLEEAVGNIETTAPLADALNIIDGKIGENSARVDQLLTEFVNTPLASDELDKLERATETADSIRETLAEKLANLDELVMDAEQHVLDMIDEVKEGSSDLTEELTEVLSSSASEFENALAEEVFERVRGAVNNLVKELTEVRDTEIEEILDAHLSRVAGEVADSLDAVLEVLRRSMEQLMDEIARQLELDTKTEQSGRQNLEGALVPLEAAMDAVRATYSVFQDIANTVGVSLPDIE